MFRIVSKSCLFKCLKMRGSRGGADVRRRLPGLAVLSMSASFSSIALAWAWSMAIWRRSDSQGHADFGGALHIAQLGSASIVRVLSRGDTHA